MSDFDEIQKALFQAANRQRVPDVSDWVFNVVLNLFAIPALAWAVFVSAGLLPQTWTGFLSVTMVVALLRLCVLDSGLAQMDYKIVPIEPVVETDDTDDEEEQNG